MSSIDINRVVAKFEKRVGELSTQNVLLEAQVEALLEERQKLQARPDGQELSTAPPPTDDATE